MNWHRLLTSPPPAAAWDLDRSSAVMVYRFAPAAFHCAAEDTPAGAFEVGPVGLQAVDRKLAGPCLARLRGAAEGARNAAVIVPSSWLRSFLLEAEGLPRRERELHEVVRWRLKKLLPVAPTELRLSIVRSPELGSRRKLVVLAGIEKAVAALETAFQEIGIEVGLVTTRLFASVPRGAGAERPAMIVQVEDDFLSVLVLEGGAARLLRSKPLPSDADAAETITRELRLTLDFVRDRFGLAGEIEVSLVCPNRELEAALRRWVGEQPRLAPLVGAVTPACGPTTVADRIGAARLAPAVAVVNGEVR